ncbi:MAG TPA: hypothetical protein H9700_13250 [Candidatus Eisenbergiella intestinipullorum]|nr:hypothetical protein [Candidatus Eisenbergiella intestinipullorum]
MDIQTSTERPHAPLSLTWPYGPARFCCSGRDMHPCRNTALSDRKSSFLDRQTGLCCNGEQDYRNTPFLQVYGHGGGPCPVCGDTLCRTVIGGKSSVYCPSCQKQQ